MTDAFYEPDGAGRVVATAFTRGPWDRRMQHGGPPAALLARALTDVDPVEGQQLARVTYEILRPIPIGPVRIAVEVARSGKRVSMVTGVLTDDDGTELVVARGWRVRTTPDDLPATGTGPAAPPLASAGGVDWFDDDPSPGFPTGVEVRFVHGGFTKIGPGTAWIRLAIPLVAGTPWRPSDVLFTAGDCGNGISGTLDFSRYVYINPDLTIYVERFPRGEWVCVDAETTISPGGLTVAASTIHDEQGEIAKGMQTLYVAAR